MRRTILAMLIAAIMVVMTAAPAFASSIDDVRRGGGGGGAPVFGDGPGRGDSVKMRACANTADNPGNPPFCAAPDEEELPPQNGHETAIEVEEGSIEIP